MDKCELWVETSFFDEMEKSGAPGEVVIIVDRGDERLLLMTKSFYPPDVYRLPTGKMKPGELPDEAFRREVMEETGFEVDKFVRLADIRYIFRNGLRHIEFHSYLIKTSKLQGEPEPLDKDEQITGFREVDVCELEKVADGLRNLPKPWTDWGQFRAIAHEVAFQELCITSD